MPFVFMQPRIFASTVVAWFENHGRKDLPWQRVGDPYAVWVSEIMLQQTQVARVIPYYQRFMVRFSSLLDLADAPLDEVLHHWSGLGYYARARNLHAAAQMIRDQYHGRFPKQIDMLQSLPGIGRSTAGAILSFAWGQPHPILDGNVKRVLVRHFAVEGWPGKAAVLKRLWGLAESFTPKTGAAAYNQAMMDLGALLCQRGAPLCHDCPLQATCQAYATGRERELPVPKPRKILPVKSGFLLVLRDPAGAVMLEQRPPAGIWGGLWSFPECPIDEDPLAWCQEKLAFEPADITSMPKRRHTFSHFHFDMTPVEIRVKNPHNRVMDDGAQVWYKLTSPDALGLAAPVLRILDELNEYSTGENG